MDKKQQLKEFLKALRDIKKCVELSYELMETLPSFSNEYTEELNDMFFTLYLNASTLNMGLTTVQYRLKDKIKKIK